jgi:hypothetical protein
LNAGGVSSNQIQSHKRTDGVTEIIYRKTLAPTSDPHDNEIFDDKVPEPIFVVVVVTFPNPSSHKSW